jgi:hypothetical protein
MAQAETVTFRVVCVVIIQNILRDKISLCTGFHGTKYYTQGQEVWIPHAKEGWICGEIQSLDAGGKNELVVLPEDGGEVSFHRVKKIIATKRERKT